MEHKDFINLVGDDLEGWIECLLYNSVDFGFIRKQELVKAKQILNESKCSSGDEFFDTFYEDSDSLTQSLVNATQI
jgi:hypothetical protein